MRTRTALAVAFIAAATLYLAFRGDLGAARTRAAFGSQVAQTACGAIEYSSFGKGPPVLLVHGGAGGIDQTREYALRLAALGLRVVTMSRFGYLRTPLPRDGSAEAQADAHACLLDSLRIDRAAIIGVSAGSPSTLQFAIRHPQRLSAMVLIVPAAYAPRAQGNPLAEMPRAVRYLYAVASTDFTYWLISRVVTLVWTWPDAAPEEQDRLVRMIEQPLPVSLREAGLKNDFAVMSSMRSYHLERIAARTLVLSVADDHPVINAAARHTVGHIPGARHIEYPDGGHLWIGRNEQVVADVAAFIRLPR